MFLTINGCKHYREDTGPKGACAILTLHGGGGMGDSRAKRAAFGPLDDTYRVITYDARMLREGIPNSRLEIFAECGHGPHTENTPKFVAVVREFLAQNAL